MAGLSTSSAAKSVVSRGPIDLTGGNGVQITILQSGHLLVEVSRKWDISIKNYYRIVMMGA